MNKSEQITLIGIAVWDRIRPETTITIIDGGIGSTFVTINILTLPGQRINSLFKFYLYSQPIEAIPKIILKDFYETRIDIRISNENNNTS